MYVQRIFQHFSLQDISASFNMSISFPSHVFYGRCVVIFFVCLPEESTAAKKRWRLVHLPIILSVQPPENANKYAKKKLHTKHTQCCWYRDKFAQKIWLFMCLLAVLGSQCIVVKCAAAIFPFGGSRPGQSMKSITLDNNR